MLLGIKKLSHFLLTDETNMAKMILIFCLKKIQVTIITNKNCLMNEK